MKNCARFDMATVKGDAIVTDEGYIRANAVVTRTGVFLYKNADGSLRKELRHPDDVWDEQSISSMQLIPVTNNHPIEKLVTAENSKRLAIGYTGESIKKEGKYILANLVVTDKDGVNAIINDGRKELSLGYTVDLDENPGIYEGEQYDARQTNIRYNHLAIVDKARAGSEARIALDHKDAVEIKNEVCSMKQRRVKIDNDEIMVEESVADYIDRLERDMKNLLEERDRVESEIKMIRDKLEKAEGERDSSKDMLLKAEEKMKETNNDSESFKKAVSERVKLYKIAEINLDSFNLSKFDSLSDYEIKKLIISSCRKSINLDGKGHAYLDAMFDTIIDEQSRKSVNVDNVSYSDIKADIGFDPSSARQRMMDKMKQAHKGVK